MKRSAGFGSGACGHGDCPDDGPCDRLSPRSDDAATEAFDAIAKLCGCPEWEYLGQVVRDVERVVAERDAARAEAEAWKGHVSRFREWTFNNAWGKPDKDQPDRREESWQRLFPGLDAALSPPVCDHRRRRVHDADCTANPLALQMCDCPGVAPCEVAGCTGHKPGEERDRG